MSSRVPAFTRGIADDARRPTLKRKWHLRRK